MFVGCCTYFWLRTSSAPTLLTWFAPTDFRLLPNIVKTWHLRQPTKQLQQNNISSIVGRSMSSWKTFCWQKQTKNTTPDRSNLCKILCTYVNAYTYEYPCLYWSPLMSDEMFVFLFISSILIILKAKPKKDMFELFEIRKWIKITEAFTK